MYRLKKYKIEEIVPFIGMGKQEFYVNGNCFLVNVSSDRLRLFQQNRKCVVCGIEGTVFILEHHHKAQFPHFNLYAQIHDELILMTKDHIVPKCKGGKDNFSNYQPMCGFCNSAIKNSSINMTLEHMKLFKQFHDSRRMKGKKKAKRARQFISEERKKLDAKPLKIGDKVIFNFNQPQLVEIIGFEIKDFGKELGFSLMYQIQTENGEQLLTASDNLEIIDE